MMRLPGLIGVVLGVVVGVLGALPTGWFGRLNGVGGGGHLTADIVVGVGVVLFVLGVVALVRPPAGGRGMRPTA
jgi:hypothetical protein